MFKEKFKYFKSKNTLPSLDQVLDFDNPDKFSSQVSLTQLCIFLTFQLSDC